MCMILDESYIYGTKLFSFAKLMSVFKMNKYKLILYNTKTALPKDKCFRTSEFRNSLAESMSK